MQPAEPLVQSALREAPVAPAKAQGTAGMVVAIDPETGQLGVPNAEQLRELFPLGTHAFQTPEGFAITYRPDGSVSIEVGSQLQEYSFVRIGPDGKRVHGCAPGPPDLRTIEALPLPSAPLEEK